MLRISQRCEYGIRAVLELALRRNGRPVAIADIAQAQGLPAKFLAAILAQLKQAGVVESVRGIQGGYRLHRRPAAISLAEVVRVMDGPVEAAAGTDTKPDSVLNEIRAEMSRAIERVLDGVSFADLVEREMRRRESSAVNYCI